MLASAGLVIDEKTAEMLNYSCRNHETKRIFEKIDNNHAIHGQSDRFYRICNISKSVFCRSVHGGFIYDLEISGLTQKEFAARSGLGLRFVRELEQGKETVRLDKVNVALAMFDMEAVPGRKDDE